ncbi:neuraminidase-like domain-containing protein [Bradyrhizobium sp. Ai1a-2]|uniref:Tc toxin subunit A-related protein n=1 Tax=Bradyrhizobium sp. Ai1a-2 TaxID=196490 RepID=UPI000488D2A8|nr:neuraminidase-like domain-containing protein [Bradyrhizobium sp. Ai1a-2]
MKAILPITKIAEPAKEHLAALHAALAFLWGIADPPITKPAGQDETDFDAEVADSKYATVTTKLVKEFQVHEKIKPASGVLTPPTAAGMNGVLHKEQQVRLIKGHLGRRKDGNVFEPLPLLGVTVAAYEETGGESPPLWGTQTTSESDGSFSIYGDLEEPPLAHNIFERAFATQGQEAKEQEVARSPVLWNAFATNNEITFDLAVEETKVRPIEYPWVLAEVQARVTRAALPADLQQHPENITPDQAKVIFKVGPDTGAPREITEQQIEHLVIAHLLQVEASRVLQPIDKKNFLDPPFFYGILRLEALLYASFGRNLEKPEEIRPDAQLRITLADLHIDAEARRKHLGQIAFYSETELGQSPEEALFKVIQRATYSRIIEARHLEGDAALRKDDVDTLSDLRKYLADEYKHKIPFHRRIDRECLCPDKQAVEPDKALNDLLDSGKLPDRYRAVAQEVLTGQASGDPKDAPFAAFQLLSGNVYRLASELQWNDAQRTADLLSLQRVALLTQDPAEIGFLLTPGEETGTLDSAWKIRMVRGQGPFVADYVKALADTGKEAPELRLRAQQLFARAEARANATAYAFGEARALATAQHVDALCAEEDRTRLRERIGKMPKDAAARLPSWEMLFGSLDACACDECDSIYGPASYLVDVLQFFKRLDRRDTDTADATGAATKPNDGSKPPRPCLTAPEEARTVFDVLMSRRPDIGYLDLNCANAMTPVPYIDLVNELLEDFVRETSDTLHLKLDPGPIPGVVVNALKQSGFRDVTDKAQVTADSEDNRLVRDERALILFQREGEEAGCPVWRVKRLRQTYGSEKEIAAAPEYVNQAAMTILKQSHLSLALPFDADRIEAVAHLVKMETDRASAMRALAKWPELGTDAYRQKVATEALGLTPVERDLITTPDPDGQHGFWAEEAATLVENMRQLRRFLDKTGLKTEPVGKSDLDEFFAGKFINPCGSTLSIVSDDPGDLAARCDTRKMHIEGLDTYALDRINRFLRLWRKLGWRIDLLDRLIMSPAVGKGKLDRACIIALADITRLAGELEMEPQKVAAWFADISVFGETSDYRRVFLQKQDDGYPYEPFLLENLCAPTDCKPDTGAAADSCPTIAEHKLQVARAVGIPAEQLDAWLNYCGNEPENSEPAKLSLRNLSRIFGWFRLVKKLGLSMRELILLLAMQGIKDALESPAITRDVRESAALLKTWRIRAADVRFWLLHRTENAGEEAKRVIPDFSIARLLAKIRTELKAIGDARPAKGIVQATPAHDGVEAAPGDAMATCLQKLASVLSQVPGLSAAQALLLTNLVERRVNETDVQSIKTLLTAEPLAAIDKVIQFAEQEPVNAPGEWIESAQKPTEINHGKYQTWTHDLVEALLDHVDDLAREGVVIRIVSQEFRAPAEQAEAILRGCRMPKDGAPAQGDALLAILAEPDWAKNPLPDDVPAEALKAAEALWDAALCANTECLLGLEERPRKFRDAVLSETKITSWTPPLTPAQVEQWREWLSRLFVAVRLAHKVAGLATALRMQTEEQLSWGLWRDPDFPAAGNRFQRLGWFSPDEMPLTPPATGGERVLNFSKWTLFLEGLAFVAQYPRTETPSDPNVKLGGSTSLELALKDSPAKASGNPATILDTIRDILAVCYQLFGSSEVDLFKVADWLQLPRSAFKSAKTYARLERAAAVIRRLGIASSEVAHWDSLTAETATRELALFLRQALKQQSDDATWLDTLKEIQDPIRERKRDALVAYLIADPHHGCFREVNDLYDHFLIDAQMCACMPTSRIVQAHAVVQLFAQRCLMGQEPSVDPRADDKHGNDWKEWPWMRNYRVWQANRKIFLYPENWIEPELRDDKSQFFKEFEQTLLQAEVNDSNVEVAARSYLDKLDDAAFMEVMAIHYQDTEFGENGKVEGRVLHVVARTKGGDPPTYFYRRFVKEEYWTAWEKVDLDIATDHVLLFVRNNRLNIAWPEFTDVVEDESAVTVKKNGDTYEQPRSPRGWTIQLAMSERSNGRWQPKRVSKDVVKTKEMVKAKADEMTTLRKRCRFVIRDREPRQVYFLDTEASQGQLGFFILVYGFVRADKDKNLIAPTQQAEPMLLGAFNLAGCKGYPEVVPEAYLPTVGAGGAISIPRLEDVSFETQRWIEQGSDAMNDLVLEGLTANNFAVTEVLHETPGTFKVTTAQQTTIVDEVLINILRMLKQEPVRWQPSGVFVPFFYEDGRRGYVAVPTMRYGKARLKASISALAKNLGELASDIKRAAEDHWTWEELVELWEKDTGNKKPAFKELKAQLGGCFGLRFIAFYHPFVCLMKRSLAAGGFERLMNASSVTWDRRHKIKSDSEGEPTIGEFQYLFSPQRAVLTPYPEETKGFEFDRLDSYSDYNWEVFYHMPTLVSQKMVVGQKFEDALRWFHFIFNPAGIPEPPKQAYGDDIEPEPALKGPARYWVTKPFRRRLGSDDPLDPRTYVGQRIETILGLLGDPNPAHQAISRQWQDEVDEWRKNPFVPHRIARGRTVAFQKATFMRYLDALIQWGDFLFRQFTRESVNAALQLYVTAERLLGPKPRVVKAPGEFRSRTYRELEAVICGERDGAGIDPFGNSLVELENVLPPQPLSAELSEPSMPPLPAGCLASVPYFCVPRNEKLIGYWDTVADRLYKIRHCQNIEGIESQLALFAPPIDPGLLVRAIAAGLSIGEVLAQGAGELPHYRFQILAQKATELVQMVIALGNALLQAIEKKDAEVLGQLRSNHEINLLKLVKQIKIQQIQEAQQTLSSLQQTEATTEARRLHYHNIERQTRSENDALALLAQGDGFDRNAVSSEVLAHQLGMIPNFTFGGSGAGGSPHVVATFGGVTLSAAASATAASARSDAGLLRSRGSQVGAVASYDRRWDDWKLQELLADHELAQIKRQIAAADIRVQIAKDELLNHNKQIEQAEEVLAYLKDRKFSNQDLYDWMIGQISATYFQAWQMAHRLALRVERAFHFELGPKSDGTFDSYVRPDAWDALHKGLHAGDRLLFDLKRMEVDYCDRNQRELEITKHISLVRLDPTAFLDLKHKGECRIETPYWIFDLDYPGHYFRRIKNVSLSIPCVAGPYASVNCTLTLTKSEIRRRDKQNPRDLDEDEKNLLRNFSRIQSIATSSGQNDSGLFEVNFRDERYLPFEGAGAISTWTLQLKPEDNLQLDFASLTDVILQLRYTARRGGKQFEKERRDAVGKYLADGYPEDEPKPIVHRLFILEDEFPSEWHRFVSTKNGNRVLSLDGVKDRLPYFSRNPKDKAAEVEMVRLDTKGGTTPTFKLGEVDGNKWTDVGWGKWEFTPTGNQELPERMSLGLRVSFNLQS